MADRLKVAVVGAGYFAQFHYDAWARIEEAELVALCERDLEKGRKTATTYGVREVFNDVETMMASEKPDLVDLVAPPEEHLDLIRRCAAYGAAVLCQKPFCGGLEDGRKAVALAKRAGITLAVHENFRFQPWYREAKRLIEEGALGEVYQASFRLRPGDGQGPEAYLARQPYFQTMPRFLVHETAVHLIDSLRYLLGEPSGLFARLARLNPAIAGEDAGLITLSFVGGARGLIDGNRLADHASDNTRRTFGELLIEGSEACLRLDGQGRLWLRRFGAPEEEEQAYGWEDRGFSGDCVAACNRHVARHLLEQAPLETAAADYLINQAVEEAVYRSHEEGRWIDGPFRP
jgi:predicted dehydrogenase